METSLCEHKVKVNEVLHDGSLWRVCRTCGEILERLGGPR
jgi:hypothetical protein